jgi:hypothetical protein
VERCRPDGTGLERGGARLMMRRRGGATALRLLAGRSQLRRRLTKEDGYSVSISEHRAHACAYRNTQCKLGSMGLDVLLR